MSVNKRFCVSFTADQNLTQSKGDSLFFYPNLAGIVIGNWKSAMLYARNVSTSKSIAVKSANLGNTANKLV